MAEQNYSTRVIELGDAKTAALYFDEVIPLTVYLGFLHIEGVQQIDSNVVREILPPELCVLNSLELIPVLALLTSTLLHSLIVDNVEYANIGQIEVMKRVYGKSSKPGSLGDFANNSKWSGLGRATLDKIEIIRRMNLDTTPWLYHTIPAIQPHVSDFEHPIITISKLRLVDAQRLSWNQIMDLRRDTESIASLRRFRLYVFDKYSGKSRSYIEDDLLRSIDEYENTTKRWGLDTALSSISYVLKDAALRGTAVAAFWEIVLKGSLVEAISAGAVASLASLAFEVKRKRIEMNAKLNDHQLAYLFRVLEKAS